MTKKKAQGPVKLNLAVGQNPLDGYIGVDWHPGEHVDVVHNLLEFPWPFEESSVSHVFCSHFVEHIPHGDGPVDLFFQFFDELWRVMEPDGEATFIHPYCWSSRAFQDPTHRRFINETTWLYLDRNWMKSQGLDHYGMPHGDFEVQPVGSYFPPWDRKSEEARGYAQTHNINVISDLQVRLKARKA